MAAPIPVIGAASTANVGQRTLAHEERIMKKTIDLWEQTPGEHSCPSVLDCYLPEKQAVKYAIVIFPGGAYGWHAPHEGEGYAEFLNAHGITAFVCQYRIHPYHFPLPLIDARRAIRYVRFHAEEYGIDKRQIYVMGSSAGGHLAALVSNYEKELEFEHMDEIDKEDFRPNGQILCYPVIKLLGKGIAHLDSGKNFLGDQQAELGEELSPDLIVTETTPRAFIWHTFDDNAVNVINSLDYARALAYKHVNTELHIYPHGPHGMGLAEDDPYVAQWTDCLLRWLSLESN